MPSTLEGFDVFDDVLPDFVDPPAGFQALRPEFAELSQAGYIAGFPGKWPRTVLRHHYQFDSGDLSGDLGKVMKFFHDRGGRHGNFWVPSYYSEFQPSGDNSGTTVNIEFIGYDAAYLQGPATFGLGRYIFLMHVDGTINYRKVTSVSGSSTPEALTISSALSQTFEEENTIIGLMYFVRFNVDDLEIEVSQRNSLRTALSFIETSTPESEADA